MKTALVKVSDPVGFHLRAAGRIVKLTKSFTAEVTIRYDGRVANAKSIMGLASLAAEYDSEVTLEVDGPDEVEAMQRLTRLIELELGQPEVGD